MSPAVGSVSVSLRGEDGVVRESKWATAAERRMALRLSREQKAMLTPEGGDGGPLAALPSLSRVLGQPDAAPVGDAGAGRDEQEPYSGQAAGDDDEEDELDDPVGEDDFYADALGDA